MAIAQMVFTRTAECELPYNKKPNAKYNGQPAAAHSRYYLNEQATPTTEDSTVSIVTDPTSLLAFQLSN
jgi:hypothetical protein